MDEMYYLWFTHRYFGLSANCRKTHIFFVAQGKKTSVLKIFQLSKPALGLSRESEIQEHVCAEWCHLGSKFSGMHLVLQVAWEGGRGHLLGSVCQENSIAVSCWRPCRRFAAHCFAFAISHILAYLVFVLCSEVI